MISLSKDKITVAYSAVSGAFKRVFASLSALTVRLLDFTRLTDSNGDLSLSNIALGIVLAKIALTPAAALSLSELALLLPVIFNYGFKRKAQREKLQADVRSDLLMHAQAQNERIEELAGELKDYADEVKHVKTKVNLQYAQKNQRNTF